jgi:hypothetical protein
MKTRSNAILICSFPEQFTGGQKANAAMLKMSRPHQVFGPEETHRNATVPAPKGGCIIGAEMPKEKRPHQFLEPERKRRNVKDELLQGGAKVTCRNAI